MLVNFHLPEIRNKVPGTKFAYKKKQLFIEVVMIPQFLNVKHKFVLRVTTIM